MATAILSATLQSGYKHHGQSTPFTALTSDPQLLLLADRLAQQSKAMDRAHLADQHFDYRPIPIPKKFQHIFC